MSVNSSKRYFYQNVRALCIIAVILIHCPTGLEIVKSDITSLDSIYYIIMRNIINFPVPVFMFLSGYFANIEKITDNLRFYYKDRVKRLLIPYLVWQTIYNVYNTAINLATGKAISIGALFLNYVTGSGHLYFMVVLCVLTAITPLLIKCTKSKLLSSLVFLISVVLLASRYISELVYMKDIKYISISLIWIAFYYLGIMLNKKHLNLFDGKKYISILICVGCLILEIGETMLMTTHFNNLDIAFGQLHFTGFLYAFSVILLILTYCKPCKNSKLTILGDNSYGVYYVHLIFVTLMAKALEYISIPTLFLQQLVVMVISLTISCIVIYVVKKILKEKLSKSLFGF